MQHRFTGECCMESTLLTTSADIFKTSKQGYVEHKFPKYSNSKMIRITPDVVKCACIDRQPLYDLIIGRETLNELKAV